LIALPIPCWADLRALPSFPTRRSSDLVRRRVADHEEHGAGLEVDRRRHPHAAAQHLVEVAAFILQGALLLGDVAQHVAAGGIVRSEEHTSELQSRSDLVCRLLLEKKKQ